MCLLCLFFAVRLVTTEPSFPFHFASWFCPYIVERIKTTLSLLEGGTILHFVWIEDGTLLICLFYDSAVGGLGGSSHRAVSPWEHHGSCAWAGWHSPCSCLKSPTEQLFTWITSGRLGGILEPRQTKGFRHVSTLVSWVFLGFRAWYPGVQSTGRGPWNCCFPWLNLNLLRWVVFLPGVSREDYQALDSFCESPHETWANKFSLNTDK